MSEWWIQVMRILWVLDSFSLRTSFSFCNVCLQHALLICRGGKWHLVDIRKSAAVFLEYQQCVWWVVRNTSLKLLFRRMEKSLGNPAKRTATPSLDASPFNHGFWTFTTTFPWNVFIYDLLSSPEAFLSKNGSISWCNSSKSPRKHNRLCSVPSENVVLKFGIWKWTPSAKTRLRYRF